MNSTDDKIPRGAGIGYDDVSSPSPVAVAAWKTGGGFVFKRIDASVRDSSSRLADGARCAAACPSRIVFTARLDVPAASRKGRHAAQVVESLLDTKLAFPVDDSRYAVDFDATYLGAPTLSATAYVVRRNELADRLAKLRDVGIDPEYIAPESLALWRRYSAEHPATNADAPCALVRAGGDSWTLVAGSGTRPATSMSFAAGDGATVRRTLGIMFPSCPVERMRWFLCGPADSIGSDWEKFRKSANLPESAIPTIPEAPEEYLAGALAMEALAGIFASNLRPTDDPPPAVARRAKRRVVAVRTAICTVCALLVAFDVAAALAARSAARHGSETLRDAASRLAGREMHQRGPALAVAARQELDERLNPEIEAWTARNALADAAEALRVASLRDVSVHSVRIEGGKLTVAGTAATGADIDAVELALRNRGLAVRLERTERGKAIAFSGTAMEVPK